MMNLSTKLVLITPAQLMRMILKKKQILTFPISSKLKFRLFKNLIKQILQDLFLIVLVIGVKNKQSKQILIINKMSPMMFHKFNKKMIIF